MPPWHALFEQGRILFNDGRFFEAHEVWEEAWLAETGQPRRFLQGLIQITAGYHKAFGQQQPKGCARLLDAGLSKLVGSAPGSSTELSAFRQAVRASLEEARRWERGEVEGLKAAPAPRLDPQTGIGSE